MAFSLGNDANVYANGYDLSAYLNQTDADVQQDAVDVSTYGPAYKNYIYGLQNQTLTVSGFFDASSASSIETVLAALIGTANTIWTVLPAGDGAGNRGQGFVGIETDYKDSAPVAGAITTTATTQGTVGGEGLVVLAAKQTVGAAGAGTTNVTGQDFGTVLSGGTISTGGLSSYLQVFSGAGAGTVTVNVQHSTALAGTYATLVSHTAFVASASPHYERVTFAAGGTINEFLRTQVVFGAAGTVTVNNAVCRRS